MAAVVEPFPFVVTAMKIERAFVIAPLLAVLCSGCVFWHETISPGATGTVLDANSRTPVVRAEVAVSEMHGESPSLTNVLSQLRVPTVYTDADGKFSVAPDRAVVFGLIFFWWPSQHKTNEPQPTGTLVIRHGTYEPAMIPFCSELVTNVGTVYLNPVSQ